MYKPIVIFLSFAVCLMFSVNVISADTNPSTLQIHLTLVNTSSLYYSYTTGPSIPGSMPGILPHQPYFEGMEDISQKRSIATLIPYSGTVYNITLSSESNSYTLKTNQSINNSDTFLVLAEGNSSTVNNRMPMINDKTFLMKISPSFAYGLGVYRPIKITLNYNNTINLEDAITLYRGAHELEIKSNKTGNSQSLAMTQIV